MSQREQSLHRPASDAGPEVINLAGPLVWSRRPRVAPKRMPNVPACRAAWPSGCLVHGAILQA